jgi:endogenous inhibitor of DNA gyrase (YacG/DUF329 family)
MHGIDMSETIQSILPMILKQSAYEHFLSKEQIERKCAFCGKVFVTHIPKKIYCDRSCKEEDASNKGRCRYAPKLCKYCKRSFTPRSGQHIFCSRFCKNKARSVGPLSKICAACHKVFVPENSKGVKIFCSKRCKLDKRNERRRLRWKVDPAYANKERSFSREYSKKNYEILMRKQKEWRDSHKEELQYRRREYGLLLYDWMIYQLGNRCDWCGSQYRMELDHIKPQGNHRSGVSERLKDFYYGKLRVLCHDCHGARHQPHFLSTLWEKLPNLHYME